MLPVDFVMGDVLVDSEGVAAPAEDQTASVDEDEGGESDPEEDAGEDGEDDDIDEAAGFDYDGETMECTLSEGLMKNMHALDLGTKTLNLVRAPLERSGTILWTGMVGVAECSAFQSGTRELVDAVVAAHDERSAHVVLGGADLGRWASLFLGVEDPLGDGNCVSHVSPEVDALKRAMMGMPMPGVDCLDVRQATEMELLLEEEAKARRLEAGIPDDLEEGDEEEEEEEEGGGGGADAGGDADY